MSQRTRSAYDRWAPQYDTDPNPHTTLEYRPFLEAMDAAPGERILDAGCGTGRYAAAWVKHRAEIVGADASRRMLEVARRKAAGAPFVQADLALSLPFADSQFDKVSCAQTLKHLPGLDVAFNEFARILRPGGVLAFSVTHPDMDWSGYEMRDVPAFILSNEADVHDHAWADYERALLEAGFVDIETTSVPVGAVIEHLLVPASYERVRGRPQILICVARAAS